MTQAMLDEVIDQLGPERARAVAYEASLDPSRRKRLGQFFTGIQLGRVLAALSMAPDTRTVLDPMAGTGDLLDAAIERSYRSSVALVCAEGVEIDSATAAVCDERLQTWRSAGSQFDTQVLNSDAFGQKALSNYNRNGYDLVITNPPYVRYQNSSTGDTEPAQINRADIRGQLRQLIESRIAEIERPVWRELIDHYSGLADLSIPAWFLSAALVRPGGVVALVAPATWRSRDYGDVIQYLLARCFHVEYLIEDTQPGWFSDALVRTQLVVARRLPPDLAAVPVVNRTTWREQRTTIARISPSAADAVSLVGTAFRGADPEGEFAAAIQRFAESGPGTTPLGISVERVSSRDENEALVSLLASRKWCRALEPIGSGGPLFGSSAPITSHLIPGPIRALTRHLPAPAVMRPAEASIQVSQGLRTGCNGFFYVDLVSAASETALVQLSDMFGRANLRVPKDCLVPVIRRQSEYGDCRSIDDLKVNGCVLDLHRWVLPEDMTAVRDARHLYERSGEAMPAEMPPELADHVRRAALTVYGDEPGAKLIPDLSAVRTNVRNSVRRPPRFWYMLPPFGRRHAPDLLIPRINQKTPIAVRNSVRPVLVDANFSTIWSESSFSGPGLTALLNSSWCRGCMEALGTPMGGGALKLEATQLANLPLPMLSENDRQWLNLAVASDTEPSSIDSFVLSRVFPTASAAELDALNSELNLTTKDLSASRQRHAK